MSEMGIGSFASGLAGGLRSGYGIRSDIEDRRAARGVQERYLGIAEQNAGLQRQLGEQALARQQRENEREMRIEGAHRQALQILAQASGGQVDPNLPADQQVSRFVTSGFNDPRVLNGVAQVYADAGSPEAVKWLERGYLAKKEGVLDLADALSRGDRAGALAAYNRSGDVRLKDVAPAEGKEGTPTGRWRMTFEDGSTEEQDPKELMRSVFSFSEWKRMQADEAKAQLEAQKAGAGITKDLAQAQRDLGHNATELEKARIAADSRENVASTRGGGRGRGKGSGGEGEDGPDMLDATRRLSVQKDMDEFAGRNFGRRDPINADKWEHTDESRRVSNVASQLLMASIEGGRPMTMQDAARAAKEGRAVHTLPTLVNGRMVTQQVWESGDVQYPMGAATKDATKEQVLQYIDTVGAAIRQSATKPDAKTLLGTTDIAVAAKAAGMTPEAAVKRILEGPPAEPNKPAAAKGAEAPKRPKDGSDFAAEAKQAEELKGRIADLREKEETARRTGGDVAGISRDIERAEKDLGGIKAPEWKAARAELDKVNAEIQRLDSGKMRGAPGRYRDVLERKKAALEQRLREQSPSSGISRDELR